MLSRFGGKFAASGRCGVDGRNLLYTYMKQSGHDIPVQSRSLASTSVLSVDQLKGPSKGTRNVQTQSHNTRRMDLPPRSAGIRVTDDMVQVQGLQGEPVHDFSPTWSRDVMTQVANDMEESPQQKMDNVCQGIQRDNANYSRYARPQEMVPPDTYHHSSHVSLYSVMQSNVPSPYNRNPTHLNMPSGGHSQQHKYIAGMQNDTHPSRNFSTSSRSQSVQPEGHQDVFADSEPVAPQGIQGHECDRFKLWVENCHRYQFGSCDEQLQGLQTGRKTLAEIFEEQDKLISQIAEDYQNQIQAQTQSHTAEYDEDDMQALQSGVPARRPQFLEDDQLASVQGSQDVNFRTKNDNYLFSAQNACPQGVQGSDCENFQLWLQNCIKYSFADCENQLRSVKAGRKSLNDIFVEQENMIKEIAKQYARANTSKEEEVSKIVLSSVDGQSPSAQSQKGVNASVGATGGTQSSGSQGGNDDDQGGDSTKLSQRARLKRAVKEYGATVVVFHIAISLASLGGFYVAVSSGLDVVGLLKSTGVGGAMLESRLAAGASTFVVAYAVHKVFAPARIAVTLTCTPFIVRHLRRIGFLKPPKV